MGREWREGRKEDGSGREGCKGWSMR